jgi:hypothetical protein
MLIRLISHTKAILIQSLTLVCEDISLESVGAIGSQPWIRVADQIEAGFFKVKFLFFL